MLVYNDVQTDDDVMLTGPGMLKQTQYLGTVFCLFLNAGVRRCTTDDDMTLTGPEMLKETREYLGTVRSMCLNADYAAVSFEGKVQLHMVCSTL